MPLHLPSNYVITDVVFSACLSIFETTMLQHMQFFSMPLNLPNNYVITDVVVFGMPLNLSNNYVILFILLTTMLKFM